LDLEAPFAGAQPAPGAGELPADSLSGDDREQAGAVAGGVGFQPTAEVVGPAAVVGGVPVGAVEVQQVDGAGAGGCGF